jgi:hypothetical protein
LSLLLSGFNGHQQRLLGELIFIFYVVTVFSFYVFLQFWSDRVVVVERNADPRELNPNPSFVIVQGRFDLFQPEVLFDLLEGHHAQWVRVGWSSG